MADSVGSKGIQRDIRDVLEGAYDSGAGALKTTATLNVGDIEIGAVELKDATSDNRASINASGSIKTSYALKKVSTNFTRPSDTTAYAVGDAITNSTSAPVPFELDLASIGAVAGQSLEIRKFTVISSVKQATLPLINGYLSPVTFTATNDNSALDITDAVQEAGGAWFACETQNYTASNSRVSNICVHEPIILAADDTKLYGTLQSANTYTPASGEKLTIIIWVALL